MFEFFTLMTDEQARKMAAEEARKRPPIIEPKPQDVQYRPGIYRYRTKKARQIRAQ